MMKRILKEVVVWIITAEAKLILRKYKPRVVAVTGSVGKTSTKDAIFSVLSEKAFVRKSQKSFNSEVGVPLTILGVPNAWTNPLAWLKNIIAGVVLIVLQRSYPEQLILEVGADRPGDIKKIASWLKPDVVIVTRLASIPVHVEFFGSPEAVIHEKAELVRGLKEGGTLVLSADDEDVIALAKIARNAGTITTFGFSRKAEVFGSKIKVTYEGQRGARHPSGMAFSVRHGEESVAFLLKGFVGRQGIYAVLGACAVGISCGLTLSEVATAVSAYKGPPGRMRLIEGVKHTTIIDDTYNSSPVAVREALDALKSLNVKGRKVAVLGDMLELGRFSIQEHRAIGVYAFGRTDILFTVGVRSRDTADDALGAGFSADQVMQFDDARTVGKALERLISEGDVILVKGSQGARMERAVEEIMAHPEEKESLLVRQEEEWEVR